MSSRNYISICPHSRCIKILIKTCITIRLSKFVDGTLFAFVGDKSTRRKYAKVSIKYSVRVWNIVWFGLTEMRLKD